MLAVRKQPYTAGRSGNAKAIIFAIQLSDWAHASHSEDYLMHEWSLRLVSPLVVIIIRGGIAVLSYWSRMLWNRTRISDI